MIIVTEAQKERAIKYNNTTWTKQSAQVARIKNPKSLIELACALSTVCKWFQSSDVKILLDSAERLGGDVTEAREFCKKNADELDRIHYEKERAAVQALWDDHKAKFPELAQRLHNCSYYKVKIRGRYHYCYVYEGNGGWVCQYRTNRRAKKDSYHYLTFERDACHLSSSERAARHIRIIQNNKMIEMPRPY